MYIDMMTFRTSIFIFICSVNYLHAQTFSNSPNDFPRLCVYHPDPSQYYPCVLNYIGLNSWTLYHCPDQAIFDEISQQCLVKIPINDAFEQLASLPTMEEAQFHRIASFVLATPTTNEENENHQEGIVSLSPMIDQFVEPYSSKRLLRRQVKRDLTERSSGVIWSHGLPLMKLDHKPLIQPKPLITSRIGHFSVIARQPSPVSEDELQYKKVCYFTNWAQYRPGLGKFQPENIDPFLCTHIIYAFAYVDNQTLSITTIEENDEDLYQRINALKIRNPKLKTLLAVGGWNMKSYAFSAMVHNSVKRRSFIFDSINFLRQHHFDGLEIDWEYPGMRGGQADDKHYFTLFLQEFKEAAIAQAIILGQPRLLLAAAVAADQDIIANSYEIEKIANVLDFINVMTYDFHGAWQNYTGVSAPLYKRFDENDSEKMFNQDFGVEIWLKNGASAHKILLGVPLFARSFLLARADRNSIRSPTIGNGIEGPFTRSAGFLSYFEICLLQADPKWQKRAVLDGSESEYMFKDREWITYETLENIRKRAAYVVANHLGGMFIWSLDMDDFNGAFCKNGSYPFIKNSLALLPTTMTSYI